jgi:cytochrome P450
MTQSAKPITGIAYDLADPQFRSDPADYYRWLRDEEPVHHHASSGTFLLSRFDDVLAATLDSATFSSASPVAKLRHMASMDPPDHDRLRSSVARWFTPTKIASLEPMIRETCRRHLEPMRSKKRIEIVSDFASLFPSEIIHRILGIPEELDTPLRVAALAIGGAKDSASLESGMLELEAVTRELTASHSPSDKNGILQALLKDTTSTRLEAAEIRGICSNLVLAGTDTVTNLLGNGLVLLAAHPKARRALVEEPDRIPQAIEEMLRFESPVQSLARRTTRDCSLHDIPIPMGSELRLMWGAANRDDRVFDRADEFDIARVDSSDHRHLALGHGIHFCLGAGLARLEARIAIEEILSAWPDYQVDEKALVRLPSLWVRAWQEVPLEVE